MKSATPQLIAYLNSVRGQTDAALIMADCFTFTLLNGTQLFYTNVDVPVTLNGNMFLANSLRVDGLKYKCDVGLKVDQQKITITAAPTEMIDGVPALAAIQSGILDGAEIRRDRAFLSSWQAGDAPIGSILLFKGRVGEVDQVGRTQAKVNVNSDLVLLDLSMPRNVYSPGCQWVLYGFGCSLSQTNFTASGSVQAGPNNNSQIVVPEGFANSDYTQGTIKFTSGVNEGLSAFIKSASIVNGIPLIVFAYPLQDVPNVGDGFEASFGCDHTMATCQSKFNNLVNFRGFPFIPPPTFAP